MTDKILTLDDLTNRIIKTFKTEIGSYHIVLYEWKVTGRKNHHRMAFTFQIVLKTNDGKRYVLDEQKQYCFEGSDLGIEIPKEALKFGPFEQGD